MLLLVPGLVLVGLKPSLILGEGPDTAAQADIAAAAPEAATAPTKTIPTIAPRFSTVRINSMGEAVITGQAPAGALVTVLSDGVPMGSASSDEEGHWALLPREALETGAHELSVITVSAEGQALAAQDVVRLTVPALDSAQAQAGLVLEGTALERVASADDEDAVLPIQGVAALDQPSALSFSAVGRLAEPELEDTLVIASVPAQAPLETAALPDLPVVEGPPPAIAAPVAVAEAVPAPAAEAAPEVLEIATLESPEAEPAAPRDVSSRPLPSAVDFAAAEDAPAGTVRASLSELASLAPADASSDEGVEIRAAGDAAMQVAALAVPSSVHRLALQGKPARAAEMTSTARGPAHAFSATVPTGHAALTDKDEPEAEEPRRSSRNSRLNRPMRASLVAPSKLRIDPSLTKVHVDMLARDAAGDLRMAGYAAESARVQVLIGEKVVSETVANAGGRWSATADLASTSEGTVVVEVRQLTDAGEVASVTRVPYRAGNRTGIGAAATAAN